MKFRWLQVVVLSFCVSGCVPSACIWVGDLELPRGAVGLSIGFGTYWFTEDVFLLAGLIVIIGVLQRGPDAASPGYPRAAHRAPSSIDVLLVTRNANDDITSKRKLKLKFKLNGDLIPKKVKFGNQFFSAGSSVEITGTPRGRPLPAGFVFDGQFNYTPNGEDDKTLNPR